MREFFASVCLSFLILPLFASADVKDSLALRLVRADSDWEKIGLLETLAGKYDEHGMNVSLEYARELMVLLDKQPQNLKTAKNYADAAIIFLNCNVYDKSLELLLKALKIFERENQQSYMIKLKNTMGGVYMRLGKNEQALEYFKEGLQGAEKLIAEGDTTCLPLLYIFYNNIGLIYNGSEDKRMLAGNYFEKALELIGPDNYYNLGQCYNNMATFYLGQEQFEKAETCARESMRFRELACDELGKARTNYTLARIYAQQQKKREAWEFLREAEERADQIKSDLLLENIYSLWVKLSEDSGDFRTATAYLHKQLTVQSNLANKQMLEKTTAQEMEYKFEKQLAEHHLVTEKKQNRSRILLLSGLMLMLVVCLLYLLVLNRNRRIRAEKKALEVNLENKNKELTTNVMYLMKNTELVKDIITRMVVLGTNVKSENARIIKDIISDLENSLKDDSWSEFEAHFNNVHLDFYRKLKDNCAELTPAELKMCAFLRLNMSSKEIASISGITVKSVDVIRGRIRKKLNISNTEVNLVGFLSQF